MHKFHNITELSNALVNKIVTKKELYAIVKEDFGLIPLLLTGTESSKPAVRYGCSKVLMDLSEEYPEQMYPHFDFFVDMLDSKHRILTWNSLAILANLSRVDDDKKFDSIFRKYFNFIDNEYMVTVGNVVGNSGRIALTKPYLIPKIIDELIRTKDLSITSHLSEECKRVIAQHVIKSFDLFFDKVDHKEIVLSFVKNYVESPRNKLRVAAKDFLQKWDQSNK